MKRLTWTMTALLAAHLCGCVPASDATGEEAGADAGEADASQPGADGGSDAGAAHDAGVDAGEPGASDAGPRDGGELQSDAGEGPVTDDDAGDADAGAPLDEDAGVDGPIYSDLAPEPASYDGPLRITAGGTYSGAWRSDDPDEPAVVIATDEPVIIEGCFVRAAGWGFREGAPGIQVTIRDCQIRPTPGAAGQAHALGFASASNVLLENNYLEDVDGFEIYQWWVESTPTQTLRVLRNRAKNIRTHFGNFVILNTVNQLVDAEIAWNEVINAPNESSVEDNINFYNSSGVPSSPIRVHDNFVWGAYPEPATAESFTGTGITTDGSSTSADTVTAYVHAYDNQFVGTCNAAMNIAAGHDILYERNRMITSAKLADGTSLNATHAATAIFDFYNVGTGLFHSNRVDDNVIGFVSPGYNNPYPDRNDGSTDGCADCSNTSLPNPITYESEQQEYERWQAKVSAAGLLIGPR